MPTLTLPVVMLAMANVPGWAQAVRPIARAEAIETALARGPRAAAARAEAAAARAGTLTARAFPNPQLTAEYTGDSPQRHALVDAPLEFPWQRGRRIGAAASLEDAAGLHLAFELAAATLDADTAFTRAQWAAARMALSRGNAAAADTLLRMARARRDAGDASELDVLLADVFAGHEANTAAADSVELNSRLLDLQAVMGLDAEVVIIAPGDSLSTETPVLPESEDANTPLSVAAAERTERSAALALRFERGNVWPAPSLTAGIETHDVGGDTRRLLPVLGLSIPLPLLDRNRGPIALAEAEHSRARVELTLTRIQSRVERGRARREATGALARLSRDRALLASADRVTTMSLTAYREGAAAIAGVLEAQRNARDVRAQFVDDLAAAAIAIARLRTLSVSAPSP